MIYLISKTKTVTCPFGCGKMSGDSITCKHVVRVDTRENYWEKCTEYTFTFNGEIRK